MRKSKIIATCLVKPGTQRLADAESSVKEIFETEYPDDDFDGWNTDVEDARALAIISTIGRRRRIDVRKLIRDLWLSP